MNGPYRPDDTPEEFPPGYDEVRVEIADPLDEPPGNVDGDGVAHFCVIPPDGDEYCGGCQKAWPCDDAQRMVTVELPPQE